LALRAGEGEQGNVFEPHTNMHRPYEEMFVQDEKGVRPLSKAEFVETLDNLAKEPGTAFQMPENISEAYKQYLEHPAHGQMDLFGAHEVPVEASHKTLAEMTPAEKTKFTKTGKKLGITPSMEERMKLLAEDKETGISQLRAGFTADDFLKAFPSWKNTRVVGNDGKPLVLYRGGVGSSSLNQGFLKGEPRQGYATFASPSPHVASSYARPEWDASTKAVGGVTPLYVNARRLIEFPVGKSFDKFAFDRKARSLNPGEVLVARDVYDYGPRASTKTDPQRLYSYKNDVYAWGEGTETKSALFPDAQQSEQGLFPGITKLHANFDPEAFKMAGLGANFGKSPMLNIPGVGDRLKSIGNAMIETPEAAIDLAIKSPDVSQNGLQQKINALTKGGAFLKAKVNNPVVHYTVDRFLKADGQAKAEVFEKLHTNYLGALRELSKAERTEAFELLNLADLNQKTITPEMMQKYGLSEKLQNFITEHQTMMDDVLGKINAAREATGKKPITGHVDLSTGSLFSNCCRSLRNLSSVVTHTFFDLISMFHHVCGIHMVFLSIIQSTSFYCC